MGSKPGNKGKIKHISESPMSLRLLQMGFTVGSEFEIPFEAPYSRDPIAVLIRGALVALRRAEAKLIEVEDVI